MMGKYIMLWGMHHIIGEYIIMHHMMGNASYDGNASHNVEYIIWWGIHPMTENASCGRECIILWGNASYGGEYIIWWDWIIRWAMNHMMGDASHVRNALYGMGKAAYDRKCIIWWGMHHMMGNVLYVRSALYDGFLAHNLRVCKTAHFGVSHLFPLEALLNIMIRVTCHVQLVGHSLFLRKCVSKLIKLSHWFDYSADSATASGDICM